MITLALALACAPKIDRGPVPVEEAAKPVRVIERPDDAVPNVYLQAIVAAGSAWDPLGSEGLANLTARALVEAGAGELSGQELKRALYPTGNELEVVVDKEWVSLRLTCHEDHAALCIDRFADALTAPRFDAADVERVRDEALYSVTEGLLSNEEALGYTVFDDWIFEGHPYGHPIEGRAGVLGNLGPDQARAFHRRHYVRAAVIAGIGGSYTPEQLATLRARLDALPGDLPPELPLQKPVPVQGRSLLAVDTGTPVTGFHLGHPLPVTRDHADWPALYLAMTAFGAHRQSSGRLFRTLRTARGLNYGDYAYVEPFVQRGWTTFPEQGVLRRQPFFYVWLRPTGVENGAFALKLAIDELEKLVDAGLAPEEFEDTRRALLLGLPMQAPDPGRRLAYTLDAAATGMPDLYDLFPATLPKLTVEEVNAALKRHIRPGDLRIVAVSGEAAALRDTLVEGKETPIVYADVQPEAEQASRDAQIAVKPLGIASEQAKVTESQGIFR